MNPDKRRALIQKSSNVAPPPVHMSQQPQPQGQVAVGPHSDGGMVTGTARISGVPGATVQFVQPPGSPQSAPGGMKVRGATPVAGASTGASVQMVNAQRGPNVRGATMTQVGGSPQFVQPAAQQPMMHAPMAQGGAWSGQPIAAASPTPAAAPVVDLMIVLSQRARPAVLERQLRAIQSATVRPAGMACYINPVGIQLNDRLLQGIPTMRASQDMGPWQRWYFAMGISRGIKYVLVIDDDCVPGINWIRLALERLELAEIRQEKIVVCAAGIVYQSDDHSDFYPLGPEAPRLDEQVADVGRGAWMMPRDLLADMLDYPALGSVPGTERIAVPLHLSAAMQEVDVHLVVLPYPPNTAASWGMLESPKVEGSTSKMIDDAAKAQQDYPAAWYRADAYGKYRGAGWEPLVVMRDASTVQIRSDEFGTMPEQTTPVPAALSSKKPDSASAP